MTYKNFNFNFDLLYARKKGQGQKCERLQDLKYDTRHEQVTYARQITKFTCKFLQMPKAIRLTSRLPKQPRLE